MTGEALQILDTTLRDGEQSPGVNLSLDEKVEIAAALERLGVDIIEAGFASSSDGEFAAVHAVASAIKHSRVCSLCRAVPREIETTARALRPAAGARIHIVLSTSPLHMNHKLQLEPEAVLQRGVAAVKYARRFADDVELSCEDASRSEPEFLCRFIEAVIEAGATTISLPDTVGYTTPAEYGEMFRQLQTRIPSSHRVCWSAHCHDDLGLAVANTLEAIRAGVRQVECTINGIGERAGNASLEEIVMALRTRRDLFALDTRIVAKQLVPVSRLVSRLTGMPVQPNKAIVGENAFRHESGIHQDGMLKNPRTYQIMDAADVGWDSHVLVLGKFSGRSGYRNHMGKLGVSFASDGELERAFLAFKRVADRKPCLTEADLLATVGR